MKRIIAVSLIAGSAMMGAAAAQERISTPVPSRPTQAVVVVQQGETGSAAFAARRCSGVGCLQGIPSLGVAF